jgi:malate synthase
MDVAGLRVDRTLHAFVEDEALPGSGVESATFWAGALAVINEFAPRNRDLLARRAQLQESIDDYHGRSPGQPGEDYVEFLRSIGYLTEPPAPFEITTTGVDPEVALLSGPQLVVPLLNARFATNAANARWGSLYDALYGTDVIDESAGRSRGTAYNPVRGRAVVAWARRFLDDTFALGAGSHVDATAYRVDADGLAVVVDGAAARLRDPSAVVGYQGQPEDPTAIVLVHHGCSSTPASSIGPATRSTPRCWPGRWCAKPICAVNRGSRRTRTTTSTSG